MGRTEDHVEAGEIDVLDGAGHQRQEKLILARQRIEPLQARGADIGGGRRAQCAGIRDGGEERGIGKQVVQFRKHVLGSSEGDQPICDESEAHGDEGRGMNGKLQMTNVT
jgi:hypothetical protein